MSERFKEFFEKINQNQSQKKIEIGCNCGMVKLYVNSIMIDRDEVYLFDTEELIGVFKINEIKRVALYKKINDHLEEAEGYEYE